MHSPTKAELLAENAKLNRRVASLERAKQKVAAAPEEIKRLRAELRAAAQRRAATAKILAVIARSPADAQPVFNAIAENSIRLLGGRSAVVTRVSGEDLELVAFTSTGDKGDGVLKAVRSVPLSDASDIHCRVVRSAAPEFHADIEKDSKATPEDRSMARARGFRSVLSVPMLRDGVAIGTIGVTRARAGAFSAHEVGLMTTFADQAVIAIENVRLFNETTQALERQTATAEILRVISSSPDDTRPVFDAIARTGARLVNGMNVAILLRQGAEVVVAGYSAPGREDLPEEVRRLPLDREKNFPSKVILDGEILHIPDWEGDDIPEFERSVARAYGVKAVLQVPMLRNQEGIGALVVSRATKGTFDAKDIALLRSFADQAVIAIENVRLFNETKEALERQTATSEILRVIASSPSDVQPVFDAIAERAAELCAAKFAYVTTFDGELVHLQATHGPGSDEHRARYPLKPGSHSIGTRVIRDGAPVCVEDVLADAEYSHKAEAVATGFRSAFGVPMMRDGRVLGAISLARPDPGAIPEKLIDLLQTFADQAVIAIENVRLFNETKEALERQTATAEILKVIARTPDSVQPVFNAIVESCLPLFGGMSVALFLKRGDLLDRVAYSLSPDAKDEARDMFPTPLQRGSTSSRAILTGQVVQVTDVMSEAGVSEKSRAIAQRMGFRSIMAAPLLRDGDALGTINVFRAAPGAFSPQQVALLQTFADQAVIAIENVRLFNETKEALERQTATAEILKVISGSPTDVQPVFDAIVASAARLFHPHSAAIVMRDGDLIRLSGAAGPDITNSSLDAVKALYPVPFDPETMFSARVISEARVLEVPDTEAEGVFPTARKVGRAGGFRSSLYVPLVREGVGIGAIVLTHPNPGTRLTDKQFALLQTFADQAVIAIENVRLFNETKEALERQTATAEILKVIASSPSDVQPVLDAIAGSAMQLLGAHSATVWRVAGEKLRLAALTATDEAGSEALRKMGEVSVSGQSTPGRSAFARSPVFVVDTETDPRMPVASRELARARGYRSQLSVPMLREGSVAGVINITRREPGTFAPHQIELLQTFADQAVIAIENVRLFNETKEALERQTATAEILRVIASSPSDVQPVFDAIVRSHRRLFGGQFVALALLDGGEIVVKAGVDEHGAPLRLDSQPLSWSLDRGSATGACIVDARPVNLPDLEQVVDRFPRMKNLALRMGYRSGLWVPLIRDGEAIGVLNVLRRGVGEFSEHEVALGETFADQAVIAIENVRLFNETKDALERQTATAGILKVIASSPADVQPVLEAITNSAAQLFAPCVTGILMREGTQLLLPYISGPSNVDREALEKLYPIPFDPAVSVVAQAIASREVTQILDTEAPDSSDLARAAGRAVGFRSMTAAPLVRSGEGIGAITVTSPQAGFRLTEKQLSLLKTFADQAVIAIENVRLFNETKEALERQTATADILKVISSSPTDTQPVFDTIVRSAASLCDAPIATMILFDGTMLHLVASSIESEALAPFAEWWPMPLERAGVQGIAVRDRSVVDIRDTESDPRVSQWAMPLYHALGIRSGLWVPMLREGEVIGLIVVFHRAADAFAPRHTHLLETFADQAVIAIENVRLFKELESRTAALSQSVRQLTALGEVGQAISSTLDLDTVLQTIVSRALQLTGLDGGSMYEYDERAEVFHMQVSENMADELSQVARNEPIRLGSGAVGRAGITREPVQVPDTLDDSYQSDRKALLIRSGYRAVLAVPLLREDNLLGALLVTRKTPGAFPDETVALLQTFATQSAMAIQNARLFREIAEKGKQLEIASHHKSDFLASMSHELRTPLNAILGFNELILAEIYGTVPDEMREPLTDIQTSGKHLLRLINNVLDLAKIEAGRMELALAEYSVHDTVESVRSTLRPLAAEKGLEFHASVPEDIPTAYGDFGRITQCLMNLAGNSLKFTKVGKVEIVVDLNGDILVYRVNDTGIGIPPDKIGSLFTEFKQTDATIASEYGGTGLGLSISRKFIEMHGGRVWVESELGKGSSFIFEVPLRVSRGAES